MKSLTVTNQTRMKTDRTKNQDAPPDTDRTQITDTLARGAGKDGAIKAPAQGYVLVRDHGPKAARGLALRITAPSRSEPKGARAWVFHYTTKGGGLERRMTIGRVDAWPLAAARDKAKELRRYVDGGGDPLAERQDERAAPTVDELADRYIAEHVTAHNRASTKYDAESLLKQWIRPELGKMKVAEVRHADIARFHRKVTEAGTPYRANRALAVLSKMFSLAVQWELRTDNPVRHVRRNQEQKRHRYLGGEELAQLSAALNKHPNKAAANVVRLLLLTGARRDEVRRAAWDQFDLKAGVWTKPGATTKQKTEHRVPLSGPAVKLLVGMRGADPKSTALFPTRGKGPLRMDKFWTDICAKAELDNFRLHDLRHTYASVLASAGQSLPVIGALLGHTQPATTARYAHLFDDPLRAATERVGAVFEAAGKNGGAEVHKMPRRRR